jgi:hypothetical protein
MYHAEMVIPSAKNRPWHFTAQRGILDGKEAKPKARAPMVTLTRRQKWIRILAAAGISFLVGAYCFDAPPFVPTPWQARAALAEAGCCSDDEPIEFRDGTVWIGRWKYHGRFVTHEFGGSARINFTWELSLSSPFGRWKLKGPGFRVSGPCVA